MGDVIKSTTAKTGLEVEDCVAFCDEFAPDWFLAVLKERLECTCKKGLGRSKRAGNNVVTIYRNCRMIL